jgi:hypothetical protein
MHVHKIGESWEKDFDRGQGFGVIFGAVKKWPVGAFLPRFIGIQIVNTMKCGD